MSETLTQGREQCVHYYEDFRPGEVRDLGSCTVSREDILSFGRQFDPQRFHVDETAAASSPFEGLVASGWHTTSMFMRLFVDAVLVHSACVGSPGVDDLRWLVPVRPGDVLRARLTVLTARPSVSRPDRGVVSPLCELINQDDVVVFRMILHSMFLCRPQT